MEVRNSFGQAVDRMAAYLEQVEGVLILVAVTDDTELRKHTVDELRKRLPPKITLREFRFDPVHISLLEGVLGEAESANGRQAISATGLEALTPDKQIEAIRLLNLQRNQFAQVQAAIILWVNRAGLAELSIKASDFYSWRSDVLFIEPPGNWDKLDSGRRSYLQAVLHRNEYVNLQGLAVMRGGQIVQMRMDDIFIPLHAERAVSLAPSAVLTRADMLPPIELMGFPSGTAVSVIRNIAGPEGRVKPPSGTWRRGPLSERIEVWMSGSWRDWEAYVAEAQQPTARRRVDLVELLHEPRAVVLGDPGAGKTTLLRYVAYQLAKHQIAGQGSSKEITELDANLAGCLPVYLRIGEYAQHIQREPETAIDAFAIRSCEMQQLPLSPELLAEEMAKGRVLFLLDGLDEVMDTEQRRQVAERVRSFARETRCPMIVTSRIVGYRGAGLAGDFSEFTISPFDDDDVRRFAESWYGALDMPESAASLVKAIAENPAVRRLATNPLLLTIVALIHYRGTKLPHHRARLYRQAAETLVDEWMNARRVTPEGWDSQETLNLLLPAIGWHLHSTTSTGLVREEDLHHLLVETLREHERMDEEAANRRASEFRRNVNEFSGIFLERGLDETGRGVYGFLHLTFEEYFAAVRLEDKWKREGKDILRGRLHDPRWREAILLAAGHLGEVSQFDATAFVRAILEAGSDFEEILHRDVLLAARCLGDDVRVDTELRREVVAGLIKLYFASDSPKSLKDDCRAAFALLPGTPAGADLLRELLKLLSDSDEEVRYEAARAIRAIGPGAGSPGVLSELLKLLSDSELKVRSAAADAIGGMGQAAATPEVVGELVRLLSDYGMSYCSVHALGALGRAGASEVIRELLRTLSGNRPVMLYEAAQALGEMGQAAAKPEILRALERLLSANESYLRLVAARTLGAMKPTAPPPGILSELVKLLFDHDPTVCLAAARALGAMWQSEAQAKLSRCVSDGLTSLGWPWGWHPLESALGPLAKDPRRPEILSALRRVLSDSDWTVRAAAVCTLGGLGEVAAQPEILHELAKDLRVLDENPQALAAYALGAMGKAAAQPEILGEFVKLLSDGAAHARCAAACALGEMGRAAAKPDILRALGRLLSDSESTVRSAAARTLRAMGEAAAQHEIAKELVKLLSDSALEMRYEAARAIGALGQVAATGEVMSKLLKLLSDSKQHVRYAAASAIASLSTQIAPAERPKALAIFRRLARAKKLERRDAGYIALRNLLAS